MIATFEKMVRREGIGNALADGVRIAAERLGWGSGKYAIRVGGQEPGVHQAGFLPGRGTWHTCDPTSSRDTIGGPTALVDQNKRVAPIPSYGSPDSGATCTTTRVPQALPHRDIGRWEHALVSVRDRWSPLAIISGRVAIRGTRVSVRR